MSTENIYFSLDEARAELARRWQDQELRNAVEAELAGQMLAEFCAQPRAVISRQLLSPDNGGMFFMQAARYVGAVPFGWEFLGDIFTHSNPEKQGWGRLRATIGNRRALIDLISFTANNKKKISEVVTHIGEGLADFHHRLLEIDGIQLARRDLTDWYRGFGKPGDYYYPYLLHFVAHGVLFENFQTEADERENVFTQTVILPNLRKIEDRFGLRPLVVRLYPENQTDDEDFYWWSYPPALNDYIVQYAKEHRLPMRYLD